MANKHAIRVGQGYDIHALVPGRPLVLGGVTIPHTMGLLGHSDADALTHAVIDSVLGAAGLGDIGRMFPDTDSQYAGANSIVLLKAVAERLINAGWHVVNIDCSILAQAPKLAGYSAAMAANLAQALGLDADQINVKAKTNESFDAVGQKHAIAVHCVALITRFDDKAETIA